MKPLRLRSRLTLGMVLGFLVVLAASLAGGYAVLRGRVLQRAVLGQLDRQRAIASALGETFAMADHRTDELAWQIVHAKPDREQLIELMKARVLYGDDTASIGVMLEPHNPVAEQRVGLLVTYANAGVALTDFLATGGPSKGHYEYWTKGWYLSRIAPDAKAWWSDPYFDDAAGGQDVVTLDYPLRDDAGNALGMIGASVPIDRLVERTVGLGARQGQGERFLLLDRTGKVLAAWNPAYAKVDNVRQLAARLPSPALAALAQAPADAPASAQVFGDVASGRQWLLVAPVSGAGWRVAELVPERQLLATLQGGLRVVAGVTLGLLVLLLPVLFGLAHRLAAPLNALSRVAARLALGSLVSPVPALAGSREIGSLAGALESTRLRLLAERESAEESRQAQEDVQRHWQHGIDAQRSLLPADRMFFGARLQCELAGRVLRRAGVARLGYGFSAPAPGLCLFYLAAMPGPELAAAMYLARLGALIGSQMRHGAMPTELLQQVSQQWLGDSDIDAFPGVLIGLLDLDSGRLRLANAMLLPPLLVADSGATRLLELETGPAVGIKQRAEWPLWQGQLEADERLVLYSPSVAANHGGQAPSGIDRLQQALREHRRLRGGACAEAALGELHAATGDSVEDLALLVVSVRERD